LSATYLVSRIDTEAPKAIVHVYPSAASASADREEGGTGFLMAVPVENVGQQVIDHVYVVTNRHVILKEPVPAIVLRRHDGHRVPIPIPQESWFVHPTGPDDIAVAALPGIGFTEYDLAAFPVSYCIRRDQLENLDVGLGVDVYYLGRFKADQNAPSITTVRFGSISSMPVMVFHPRFKKEVESYLIEARSRGGFSGSPVVARLEGPLVDKDHARSIIHLRPDSFLLGISWSHMNEWQAARIRGAKQDLLVGLNAGILCVAPAWRIIDVIMRPELVALRIEERKAWLADHPIG
jgi:hypothetical protein